MALKPFNPARRITPLYADLDLALRVHPNKKDIVPLTDIDAVKQSVKNIVLTNYGEKLFKPKFGGNVTGLLFENVNVFTLISLRKEIESLLQRFEHRIDEINIDVIDNTNANAFDVTIEFRIIDTNTNAEMNLTLNRTR